MVENIAGSGHPRQFERCRDDRNRGFQPGIADVTEAKIARLRRVDQALVDIQQAAPFDVVLDQWLFGGQKADRVAVRFVTPETGGAAKPRFLTEREIAFFARLEAINEQLPVEADIYPERYVRAASDRLVARAMLASLRSRSRVASSGCRML